MFAVLQLYLLPTPRITKNLIMNQILVNLGSFFARNGTGKILAGIHIIHFHD